jgi:hypothetical protein
MSDYNTGIIEESSAAPIAAAVCEPLRGSTPIITAAINRSFVVLGGRTVAGTPDSGVAGVAPLFTARPDRLARRYQARPQAVGRRFESQPIGPLNATTKAATPTWILQSGG